MTEPPAGAVTFQIAAEAYDRHVGRYGSALAAAFIEAAGVQEGDRVLDVGCGPGALTRALAARVGADNVAAVEPSEPFAGACRERVPGADVRVAAAEDLPFVDGGFDAVLSQLVVNFLSRPEKGLREMARVTRPGGVVAGAVWDYVEGMTMLRVYWDAVVALDPAAAEQDEGRSMPLARPAELDRLWRGAGLDEIAVHQLEVEAAYESFDDYWEPFTTGVAPSGAYCASLDEAARERLREEVRRRLGSPAGPFILAARAWCAIGCKP